MCRPFDVEYNFITGFFGVGADELNKLQPDKPISRWWPTAIFVISNGDVAEVWSSTFSFDFSAVPDRMELRLFQIQDGEWPWLNGAILQISKGDISGLRHFAFDSIV